MLSLEDKVVAITGGSSGLGEATARHLAGRGAKVFIGARSTDALETIAEDIGDNAAARAVDVTDRASVEEFVGAARSHFGRLDALVNNAGIMSIAPMTKRRVDEWETMIDVNVKGVLNGINAALPVFEEQGAGHFVNLSSVAGVKVFAPGGTVYSGTKFAVGAISEGLRMEVGETIRVTSICPGVVDTNLPEGTSDPEARQMVNDFYQEKAIPADSVARAIAYALEQPRDVDVNEIVLRPTSQEL